jgi:hypothetical protein
VKKINLSLSFAVWVLIGLFAVTYHREYLSPVFEPGIPSKQDQINWDELTREVRPPLNPEFEKLSDRERDGLRGRVREIRYYCVDFIERDGRYFKREDAFSKSHFFTILYDKDGKQIKTENKLPAKCGYNPPSKFIYDDRGLHIEVTTYNDDASILTRAVYNHDADGKPVEDLVYYGDGSLKKQTIYKYRFDAQGNWIEQIPIYLIDTSGKLDVSIGSYRRIIYYKN